QPSAVQVIGDCAMLARERDISALARPRCRREDVVSTRVLDDAGIVDRCDVSLHPLVERTGPRKRAAAEPRSVHVVPATNARRPRRPCSTTFATKSPPQ